MEEPGMGDLLSSRFGWGWFGARDTELKTARAIVEIWKEIGDDDHRVVSVKTYVRAARTLLRNFRENVVRLEQLKLARIDKPPMLSCEDALASYNGALASISNNDLLRIRPSDLLLEVIESRDAKRAECKYYESTHQPTSVDELRNIVAGGVVSNNIDLSKLPEDALAWFGERSGLVFRKNVSFIVYNDSDTREFVLPGALRVAGLLEIRCPKIDMKVRTLDVGALRIVDSQVHDWPRKLRIRRHCSFLSVQTKTFGRCEKLEIGGKLWMIESELDSMPAGLVVGRDFGMRRSVIRRFGRGARIGGTFEMSRSSSDRMSVGMSVGGDLNITASYRSFGAKARDQACLKLPECLRVRRRISIKSANVEIPTSARSRGLSISDGAAVSFPPQYEVHGNLDLDGSAAETCLPERLVVHGHLTYNHNGVHSDQILRRPSMLDIRGCFDGRNRIDSIETWERMSIAAHGELAEEVHSEYEIHRAKMESLLAEQIVFAARREPLNRLAQEINAIAPIADVRNISPDAQALDAALASAFRIAYAAACDEWHRLNEVKLEEHAVFETGHLRQMIDELSAIAYSPVARRWMQGVCDEADRPNRAKRASFFDWLRAQIEKWRRP
jgi:hypothetical protein